MACVTLKRPLEFDPLHHSPGGPSSCSPRPHKRRRCLPMCIPASHVPTSATTSLSASSFATLPRTSQTTATSSPFVNATPALLQSDIAQYVREEIRRLKRRRLLPSSGQSSPSTEVRSTMDMDDTLPPSASPPPTTSPTVTSSRSSTTCRKDMPLFSFKQVNQLCTQLLRERENKIREEYDSVLAHELAEQYNRCVRFTTEQIHQQLAKQDLPSYLS